MRELCTFLKANDAIQIYGENDPKPCENIEAMGWFELKRKQTA